MADDSERLYWIALNMIPGIGPRRFFELVRHFGSARGAWEASRRDLEAVKGIGGGLSARFLEERTRVDPKRELERSEELGFSVVMLFDEGYPQGLRVIHDPPPVLYVAGRLPQDAYQVSCAIVGTRRPSAYGRVMAMRIASELARYDIMIISGMARGIDSIAHKACLDAGGNTIAVLGSGLDVPYPPENAPLFQRIAERGACVSEFPLGTPPFARNFPARNRIISGLARGVVVVEGGLGSGALITASFALDQGRDVFALPGHVTSPQARGPHSLLKEGAILVEGARDILSEWGYEAGSPGSCDDVGLTRQEGLVLSRIGPDGSGIDELAARTRLTPQEVGVALLGLELKGRIARLPGEAFIRVGEMPGE